MDVVCEQFGENYPGTVIVGARNGYFEKQDEEGIALSIRDANTDVLFVAITSPKKERFMARWSAVMNVPVVHGVGGSFDVVAGLVSRAPLAWQNLGLEWLYRVIQEPRRLWKRYLVTNIRFSLLLIHELLGSKSSQKHESRKIWDVLEVKSGRIGTLNVVFGLFFLFLAALMLVNWGDVKAPLNNTCNALLGERFCGSEIRQVIGTLLWAICILPLILLLEVFFPAKKNQGQDAYRAFHTQDEY